MNTDFWRDLTPQHQRWCSDAYNETLADSGPHAARQVLVAEVEYCLRRQSAGFAGFKP